MRLWWELGLAISALLALALRHHPWWLMAIGLLLLALILFWRKVDKRPPHRAPRWTHCLLIFLLGAVLLAPWLAPYDPALRLTQGDILGLDRLGRDQLSRLLLGNRASFSVALFGSAAALTLGTLMAGLLSMAPPWWTAILRAFCQAWLAIPAMLFFFLGIALVDAPGVATLIVLMALTLWIEPSRMLEARIGELSRSEFVAVARMAGKSNLNIFMREILPNLRPVWIINLLLTFNAALLLESALGFLGLGRELGAPSLGHLIEVGAREMNRDPLLFWVAIATLMAWLLSLRAVLGRYGIAVGPLLIDRGPIREATATVADPPDADLVYHGR